MTRIVLGLVLIGIAVIQQMIDGADPQPTPGAFLVLRGAMVVVGLGLVLWGVVRLGDKR